jgi:hypothetical protein
MMGLRAMQDELHGTQTKGNALAENMKEVENGMVRSSSLFGFMLAFDGNVA